MILIKTVTCDKTNITTLAINYNILRYDYETKCLCTSYILKIIVTADRGSNNLLVNIQ